MGLESAVTRSPAGSLLFFCLSLEKRFSLRKKVPVVSFPVRKLRDCGSRSGTRTRDRAGAEMGE